MGHTRRKGGLKPAVPKRCHTRRPALRRDVVMMRWRGADGSGPRLASHAESPRTLLIIRGNIVFDGMRRDKRCGARGGRRACTSHTAPVKEERDLHFDVCQMAQREKQNPQEPRTTHPPAQAQSSARCMRPEQSTNSLGMSRVRAAARSCASTPRDLSPPHVRGRPAVLVSSAQRLAPHQRLAPSCSALKTIW